MAGRLCSYCDRWHETNVPYGTAALCPTCTPPANLTEREKKLLMWLEARIQARYEEKLRMAEEDCRRRHDEGD